MFHLSTCLFIYIGVEFCSCFMVTVAFFVRYLTFILPLFLQHYFFSLFSIFQVQGFPQTSQSLYPTMFKSDTLEHWLEALSIWEMLVWCELLCRSIGRGSLKGKLRISVSFQCHIFHHRLAIFPRKASSSILPGGWKSSFQCSGLRKTDVACSVSKANMHTFI